MTHVAANGSVTNCRGDRCRICAMIDRSGPHYREDYRRLFHPEEFPDAPAVSQPTPAIPLAGDLVAALTAKLGADRAAKWVAEKLGGDCHCAARREKMNRLDRKLRRWLGLLPTGE